MSSLSNILYLMPFFLRFLTSSICTGLFAYHYLTGHWRSRAGTCTVTFGEYTVTFFIFSIRFLDFRGVATAAKTLSKILGAPAKLQNFLNSSGEELRASHVL